MLVDQSCLALWPHGLSPSGSSLHGILQARILEWAAIPFSRESSHSRDQTWVSCIAGMFFTIFTNGSLPLQADSLPGSPNFKCTINLNENWILSLGKSQIDKYIKYDIWESKIYAIKIINGHNIDESRKYCYILCEYMSDEIEWAINWNSLTLIKTFCI